MELSNALGGGFLYILLFQDIFSCGYLELFQWIFRGQVLVSLMPPGRASLTGIKHCNFPNIYFLKFLNFPFSPSFYSAADQWTEECKEILMPKKMKEKVKLER